MSAIIITTTTAAAAAATTTDVPINNALDLGSPELLTACRYSAASMVPRAHALVRAIDAPWKEAMQDSTIRFNHRDLPIFLAAYGEAVAANEATRSQFAKLHLVPPAQRLALKQALLEDVERGIAVAQAQIAAPKSFLGVALPTELDGCAAALGELLEEAEAQRKAAEERIVGLKRAQRKVEEMVLNAGAADALRAIAPEFAAMPLDDSPEPHKRARLSYGA